VQPLLVSIENLHWIDAETQAALDSLVESLPTATLLLLVNYRPEYQHGWGSKTYYTQLRLDPLPPASAEALLQALLGDDGSLVALRHLLIERTEGTPFFLEESVRALVEAQVLVGERGAYRLVQSLLSIQVPATVQAVLAAHVDRLPAEEKTLLQTAAVIGTDVPFPLLQALAELSEEALQRGLMRLQAAEFLYETRLFPALEYTFKHALTHDVAYGSLLQARRRALHTRIVEALETLYPDRLAEHVDRLAHHALRGGVWGKALMYCRQAIDCLLQSVASLHGAQRRERLGQANVPSVQSLAYLAACHGELGLFAEGSVLVEERLQIAETVADPSSLMWASYGTGLLSLCQGDLPKALPLLGRAIGICQEADLRFFVPRVAAALGAAYILSGRVADAVALLTPLLEQVRATDMAGFQALCSLPLGEAQLLADRLEEAQALAACTLAHARQHQERGNEAHALRLLGETAAHRAPSEVEPAED
jgi:tetratricopeptide (TPR) repeat protein